MVKLLKNRFIAVTITIVAVIAATLFGVYNSANRVTREIEAMFYDGVFLEGEGRVQPALASHLENAANAALGLGTILGTYPELAERADALLLAQSELLSAASISRKEAAARSLRDSFLELTHAADGLDLDERDGTAMEHHASMFRGAFSMMQNTAYNDAAEDRLSGQSAILRVVSSFMGANRPGMFHVEQIPVLE